MKIQLLHSDAKVPTRGSASAAGYDLCCIYDFELVSTQIKKVEIGVAVAIPEGFYGRIAPRSSLGGKGVIVHGGVVDADYRGGILLFVSYLGVGH